MDFYTLAAVMVILLIISQRWFWVLVFFVGALASLFAMIASIIHFQILAAVGFFFLMILSYVLMSATANQY